VSPSELLAFLRRELVPTPGRAGATFRLTVACLAATVPILTHHIPHALIVMVVMYLVTQEDAAATVLGSVLGVIGLTVGIGLALVAWEISIDTPPLRVCFFAAFLFGGLFLKRALTIGPLGSAIGLPAALTMLLPDIAPAVPEVLTEFALWVWWCGTLGLAVNATVQFLLSPGDPLVLLRRELDTRLLAVEQALRRAVGPSAPSADPAPVPLATLAVAGMSRQVALLKTATLAHPWAREGRERLAALITLVDRLVTAARALELLRPAASTRADADRMGRAADACQLLRKAFEELRLPHAAEWQPLAVDPARGAPSLLGDIEGALDEIALAAPGPASGAASRPGLFLPDAFENREYVRFALKGTLAALICYGAFIGFDYKGIYTSVITCFVVSLSTIGSSNQKGVLRFGGAAVGGLMGLVALMYLLPNVETIAGFWLVFGAGTAVAAWVNFGSPRISYGGYQTGLAFYKAILQGFGAAVTATVIRDRLIGIAFGLIVFGLVEHVLWPMRAMDALRARLSEVLRLLAELAQAGTGQDRGAAEVDGWRQRISLKLEEAQGLIESSKFEKDAPELDALQKTTGAVQIVFLLLLSLARQRPAPDLSEAVAAALEALATRVTAGFDGPAPDLQRALDALEGGVRPAAEHSGSVGAEASGALGLYRSLAATLRQIAPAPLASAHA
jgi:multidrug resistance protein MdtO